MEKNVKLAYTITKPMFKTEGARTNCTVFCPKCKTEFNVDELIDDVLQQYIK